MKYSELIKKAAPALMSAAMMVSAMPVQVLAAEEAFTSGEEETAAFEDGSAEQTKEAAFHSEEVSNAFASEGTGYYYGTVNLPYADFYYGELNTVQENDTMELDKADPVTAAGYRSSYDSVTSATNSKFKGFESAYYTDNGNGGTIDGVADVPVRVSASLYEEAKKAIEEGRSCSNSLLNIIGSMKLLGEVPAEYKVLNGDGTLGKMVTETVADAAAKTSIKTESAWGNYLISVESDYLPEKTDIQGAVFTMSDGSKYGMSHLDNLWFRTGEIAVTLEEDFTEPHGNKPAKARFKDIQGKTITQITYLRKNGADLVVDTNLFCKILVDDKVHGVSAETENSIYSAKGNRINLTVNAPEGSSYQLASVSFGNKVLTAGTDYTYENGVLTIAGTENTGIGQYKVVFEDAAYEDLTTAFILDAGLEEGAIILSGNKLVSNTDKVTVSGYLASISGGTIDGVSVRGIGAIFNEDGSINFGATSKGQLLFAKEPGSSYEIVLTSNGYPTVKGTAVSPKPQISLDKTSVSLYKGKTTTIKASLQDLAGTVTYESDNTKVATVDSQGKITAKAQGTATITVACGEYKVSCKVTVKNPTLTLSKTSASVMVGKTVKITAKATPSGTIKYQSADKKIATVTSQGVVKGIKKGTTKITVSCNGVKKTFTVTVKNPTLTLSKTSASVAVGKTVKITAKATPSGTIKYQSANKKIATVTSQGVVKGIKKGTTKITVSCNGVKKTFTVTVKNPTLTLSKTSASVKVGKTVKITAKAAPSGTIKYQSANKKIATVNSKGVVKGVKKGKTKITVSCNGVKKTFTVTVK